MEHEESYLFVGAIMAAIPFCSLVYNQFFLFNPRRDPRETYRLIEKRRLKEKKGKKTTLLVNGSMLALGAPLILVIAASLGSFIAGAIFLLGGMYCIAWAKKQ